MEAIGWTNKYTLKSQLTLPNFVHIKDNKKKWYKLQIDTANERPHAAKYITNIWTKMILNYQMEKFT